MGVNIDKIVSVSISKQTSTPTMASFNGILIAAEFLASSTTPVFGTAERVREYGSMTEIAAAGYSASGYVYLAASAIFAQNPCVSKVFVGRKLTGADGTETWPVALAAMATANDAWYGLVVETKLAAEQEAIADWVEANKKLCIMTSGDAGIVDTAYSEGVDASIADTLRNNSYERTAVIYHPEAYDGEVPEAAWLGKCFAFDPGSITWAYKTLAGVPIYSLTSAQLSTAEDKYANVYVSIADVPCTLYGRVGSGEYLDVTHGIDWLVARIQNQVFTPIVQQGKVPYTNAGVQMVVTQMKAALQEAVDLGLLASYKVTFPLVENVTADKKQARILPDVKFTGILAGAIHKVQIQGTVTL